MLRKLVMKKLTNNLGKVVEDDEKITCYVKKSKLKKEYYNYIIACFGVGENEEKVAEAYELNKPIRYVIDGIEFKKHGVNIFGYNNCEVIVRNCNFKFDVYIHVNGKCTLDNTRIKTFSHLLIGANDLIIKNINNDHIEVIGQKSNIGFGANNRFDIINSNIGNKKENINISFSAINVLNIDNSKIIGAKIDCEAPKIEIHNNAQLSAKKCVTINSGCFDPIDITSPVVKLNDNIINTQNKTVTLKQITDSKSLKRLELVNVLKIVRNKLKKQISDDVSQYEQDSSAYLLR